MNIVMMLLVLVRVAADVCKFQIRRTRQALRKLYVQRASRYTCRGILCEFSALKLNYKNSRSRAYPIILFR